jgi:hypothetical protein
VCSFLTLRIFNISKGLASTQEYNSVGYTGMFMRLPFDQLSAPTELSKKVPKRVQPGGSNYRLVFVVL